MQTLQQRLKLASVKAEKGWTDLTLNEIETVSWGDAFYLAFSGSQHRRWVKTTLTTIPSQKLPPTPQRDRIPASPTDHLSQSIPYEPPSPSRPWQLIDVLWQPLPPPRNGSPITSPSSPRKRSRTDDDGFPDDLVRYPSPNGRHSPSVPGPSRHGHARRASGSAFLHAPLSPLGGSARWERRSQSTSQHRLSPTSQDVSAAKALTSMFESGSPKASPRRTSGHGRHASLPNGALLPPISTDLARHRPKEISPPRLSPLGISPTFTTPSSNARKRSAESSKDDKDTDDADKDAAELMMFLAHSPSPARTLHAPQSPSRAHREGSAGYASPKAARVLFADGPSDYKVERHSNLGIAPPITADQAS